MTQNLAVEKRIANRAQSIFSSLGAIINDFYLEAGIYFVGCFNAALVAWDIYTDLVAANQPLSYAIAIAVVAFIAVEGLAVYLVGAAARTNSRLLWFFSIVFALFFTYAHSRGMTGQPEMSEYVTLAIPFFVVVGYWAKTLKADTENTQTQATKQHDDEVARKQLLEDDEMARKRHLEDEEIAHNRETDRKKSADQQEIKMAKLVEKAGKQPENSGRKNDQNAGNIGFPEINSGRKLEKAEIMERLPGLISEGLSNVEIGERVGRTDRSIRNYRNQLNGS